MTRKEKDRLIESVIQASNDNVMGGKYRKAFENGVTCAFNRLVNTLESMRCNETSTVDAVKREDVIDLIEKECPRAWRAFMRYYVDKLPPAEERNETEKMGTMPHTIAREIKDEQKKDDISTMRILFNADINELLNQKRFNDAREMEGIRDRLIQALELRGEWEDVKGEVPIYNAGGFTELKHIGWRCTKCGEIENFCRGKYCRYCGAEMREDEG